MKCEKKNLMESVKELKLAGVQWVRLVPCVQTLHVVLVSIYTLQGRDSPGSPQPSNADAPTHFHGIPDCGLWGQRGHTRKLQPQAFACPDEQKHCKMHVIQWQHCVCNNARRLYNEHIICYDTSVSPGQANTWGPRFLSRFPDWPALGQVNCKVAVTAGSSYCVQLFGCIKVII